MQETDALIEPLPHYLSIRIGAITHLNIVQGKCRLPVAEDARADSIYFKYRFTSSMSSSAASACSEVGLDFGSMT